MGKVGFTPFMDDKFKTAWFSNEVAVFGSEATTDKAAAPSRRLPKSRRPSPPKRLLPTRIMPSDMLSSTE